MSASNVMISDCIFELKVFSFHWPYIWQVYKTAVTHYFSMEKARSHLGYNPQKYTLDGVIQHFKKTGHDRPQRPPSRLSYHLVNILLGIMIASLILSCLPTVTTCSRSLMPWRKHGKALMHFIVMIIWICNAQSYVWQVPYYHLRNMPRGLNPSSLWIILYCGTRSLLTNAFIWYKHKRGMICPGKSWEFYKTQTEIPYGCKVHGQEYFT